MEQEIFVVGANNEENHVFNSTYRCNCSKTSRQGCGEYGGFSLPCTVSGPDRENQSSGNRQREGDGISHELSIHNKIA